MSKIKKDKKDVGFRYSFENLITTISTSFIKISSDRIDEVIKDTLRKIAEFEGFDRSYVFIFNNDLSKMTNTHEWCANGIKPQIERLKSVDTSKFPWWMKKMKKAEPIYIPDVYSLPPDAQAEKSEFEQEEIKSMICVPMLYEKTLVGFLGFDAVNAKKICDEDTFTLLKITGEIFVNAIKRKETEKALQITENKLQILLNSIWDFLWVVNKDLIIIWANDLTKQHFGNDIIGKKCYEVLRNKKCSCEPGCLASSVFKDGNMHENIFEIKKRDKEIIYLHCKASVALRTESRDILSVLVIARDITDHIKIKNELLKARSELEKRVKESTLDLISSHKKLEHEVKARKKIKHELKASMERFKSQYKLIPIPTYTWRMEKDGLVLIDFNEAALEITESKIKNFIGINAKEMFRDYPNIISDLERCYHEETSFSKDIYYQFKSVNKGGYFTTTYGFIKPDIVIVHTEDITEKKHTEDVLKIKEKGIASSINGFINMEINSNLTYTNKAFLKMWGYDSDEEVIGKPFSAFLDNKETIEDILNKLKKSNSITGEFIGRRKDGSTFDVFMSANLITEDSDKPICIMAFFIDITHRKEMEARLNKTFTQLERTKDDLLSILNILTLGTAITDSKGRIIFLNQSAQSIIDVKLEDVFLKYWEDLFPISQYEKDLLKQMSNSPLEKREKLKIHFITKKNREVWIEVEFHDDPGNPERKILVIHDVTEIFDLRRMLDEKARFHDLIGKTKVMREIFQQIREISRVDWTVLIEGETGTGKELVARAIHFSSHRKDKPYLAVNCAGLTDSLLSSQLFGHKKGAFTGAVNDNKGFFEAANGGTIFLDEIADISLNVQTSLLRVLEEKEVTRLGESKARKVDIRIIAATNKNLLKKVDDGSFRPDLFYRIRVTRIKIPPLRERKEDIPLLIDFFIKQSRTASGKVVSGISNETLTKLLEYNWPGNVRELRSAIGFAVTHCKESIIQLRDIPPEITEVSKYVTRYADDEDMDLILNALRKFKGNRSNAMKHLNISRSTFYRILKRLNIKNKSSSDT